jgi:hypothetical protein
MSEFEMQPRRRRKREPKWKRFLRRYGPSLMLLVLVICCASMIGVTIWGVGAMLDQHKENMEQLQKPPVSDTVATTKGLDPEEVALALAEAEKIAAGYDYEGAILRLQAVYRYEDSQEITAKITEYDALDDTLVSYDDLDNITHIFFHSLIVDPARAFDGDKEQDGFNMYMVTVDEFNKILQSMYDRGYVLVSPYDIAYEVVDDYGARFEYGDIRLPEGKIPFLMSQDDVNYYGYMIGTGNGKDEKPVFADTNGDGFAHKIVIGEDGYPTCEYMDKDGNITTGDYDLVPALESFIREHPDFSYHGARAILGVTGYEGVFGYRTKPGYNVENGGVMSMEDWNAEVEAAKAVAECLKEKGWLIASHSYGHPSYGKIEADRVALDSDKWEDTVQYIVGETDIILFPHGSDIHTWRPYTTENEKFNALYEDGYRYFFNVDSKVAWVQIGDTYFRASRRNIDGYRMYHYPERLEDLFDVKEVFDPARPTPVPDSGPGM